MAGGYLPRVQQSESIQAAAIHRDGLRYLLSGGGAMTVDLAVYAICTGPGGLPPETANLISRPLGGVASFLFHKYFTFENRGQAAVHHQFGRFWMVWLLSFSLSQGLVIFYHQVVHFGPLLTKIAAEGGAGLVAFLCQRSWTFR